MGIENTVGSGRQPAVLAIENREVRQDGRYCPVCGARGAMPCATPAGRLFDYAVHASRETWTVKEES